MDTENTISRALNLNINDPVAVFDSGVGGISVLRELLKVMPQEHFYFYGDSKNAPYGTRTKEDVFHLTHEHVKNFLKMGIKGLCVACNTATSASVRRLRLMYPDLPIVGIEPALKPACTSMHHPKVLVMATPMTIREEKFHRLLDRFRDSADIYPLACPGLMEYVEAGKAGTPEVQEFLNQMLHDYAPDGKYGPMDAVVTGCTHYPFVKKEIEQALGGHTVIFDGAGGTAREMRRRLSAAGLLLPDGGQTISGSYSKASSADSDTSAQDRNINEQDIAAHVIFETSADDRDEKIELCKKLLMS